MVTLRRRNKKPHRLGPRNYCLWSLLQASVNLNSREMPFFYRQKIFRGHCLREYYSWRVRGTLQERAGDVHARAAAQDGQRSVFFDGVSVWKSAGRGVGEWLDWDSCLPHACHQNSHDCVQGVHLDGWKGHSSVSPHHAFGTVHFHMWAINLPRLLVKKSKAVLITGRGGL
jgi:hypothetical protein